MYSEILPQLWNVGRKGVLRELCDLKQPFRQAVGFRSHVLGRDWQRHDACPFVALLQSRRANRC